MERKIPWLGITATLNTIEIYSDENSQYQYKNCKFVQKKALEMWSLGVTFKTKQK